MEIPFLDEGGGGHEEGCWPNFVLEFKNDIPTLLGGAGGGLTHFPRFVLKNAGISVGEYRKWIDLF